MTLISKEGADYLRKANMENERMKTQKEIEDRLIHMHTIADDCENPSMKQNQAIENALCWVLNKPDEWEDEATPRFANE